MIKGVVNIGFAKNADAATSTDAIKDECIVHMCPVIRPPSYSINILM